MKVESFYINENVVLLGSKDNGTLLTMYRHEPLTKEEVIELRNGLNEVLKIMGEKVE